jgi:uncharacterized protein YgbK (DUF1537 family)
VIRLAIIADDLTGAADSAVAFAVRSYPTHVLLNPAYDAGADFIALATETRHLSSDDAVEQVRLIARHLNDNVPLYKKIDSTLRGNPAAELFALMEATGETRVLIAPAFPAQGRTTVNGRQLLDGVALEQTEFNPEITTSQLTQLFHSGSDGVPPRLIDLADVRQGSRRLAELLADPTSGVIIVDAETDADLDTVVEAAHAVGMRLLCGSAGLCHALARRLPLRDIPRSRRARRSVPAPTLTIAGSRHPATIAQVKAAPSASTFRLTPDSVTADWANAILDMAVMQLGLGLHTIIETSELDALEYEALAVAVWLSMIVDAICEVVKPGGLILTGGDIATFVCHKLGARAIDLRGEVQPGIPWGTIRGGKLNGLPIATKAGGFGGPDALVNAIDSLQYQQ